MTPEDELQLLWKAKVAGFNTIEDHQRSLNKSKPRTLSVITFEDGSSASVRPRPKPPENEK